MPYGRRMSTARFKPGAVSAQLVNGPLLRARRTAFDLTIEELAERVGTHPKHLQKLCSGARTTTSLRMGRQIERVLCCEPGELYEELIAEEEDDDGYRDTA